MMMCRGQRYPHTRVLSGKSGTRSAGNQREILANMAARSQALPDTDTGWIRLIQADLRAILNQVIISTIGTTLRIDEGAETAYMESYL